MIAGNKVCAFRRQWPDDLLVLIQALVHRRFEKLRGSHLAVETFGAADGGELDVTTLEPAEAHAVAVEARGESVAQRESGGDETFLGVDADHEVERDGDFLNIRCRLLHGL